MKTMFIFKKKNITILLYVINIIIPTAISNVENLNSYSIKNIANNLNF